MHVCVGGGILKKFSNKQKSVKMRKILTRNSDVNSMVRLNTISIINLSQTRMSVLSVHRKEKRIQLLQFGDFDCYFPRQIKYCVETWSNGDWQQAPWPEGILSKNMVIILKSTLSFWSQNYYQPVVLDGMVSNNCKEKKHMLDFKIHSSLKKEWLLIDT